MAWNLYCLFIFGLVCLAFVKSDWSGFGEMDCTHSWENNHCYVCGEDR